MYCSRWQFCAATLQFRPQSGIFCTVNLSPSGPICGEEVPFSRTPARILTPRNAKAVNLLALQGSGTLPDRASPLRTAPHRHILTFGTFLRTCTFYQPARICIASRHFRSYRSEIARFCGQQGSFCKATCSFGLRVEFLHTFYPLLSPSGPFGLTSPKLQTCNSQI